MHPARNRYDAIRGRPHVSGSGSRRWRGDGNRKVRRGVIEPPIILEGRIIRLEPLGPHHVPALMDIARASPEAFSLTNTPLTVQERDDYFGRAFADLEAGVAYPFAIVSKGSGAVVGTTRFNHIDALELRCDIGYTWLDPAQYGGRVNREAKRLMLSYAFEVMGVNRVQFQADVRNVRSCRALEHLGAQREGVLRMHALARDGFPRNSAIYSIIAPEWPAVKAALEAEAEG